MIKQNSWWKTTLVREHRSFQIVFVKISSFFLSCFYVSPWPRFMHMFDISTVLPVVLEEQFHFILPLGVTLAIYQGHSGIKQSNLLRYIIFSVWFKILSHQHKTLGDCQIHKIVDNYRHVCQRFEVTLTEHAFFHNGLIIQQQVHQQMIVKRQHLFCNIFRLFA